MPRVSEAHLIARRQHILDAARRVFTRHGFQGSSMQEIITEARVSVGAFYRYFKSKEELATALAESMVGQIASQLQQIGQAEPPLPLLEAMRLTVETVESELGPDGAFRFAMQLWPETFRNEHLAGLVERTYRKLRAHFTTLVEHAIAAGELPEKTDVEATGSALFALVPGYALQRVLIGNPDPESYLRGIANLLTATITE